MKACPEAPVLIQYNNREAGTLLSTPTDVRELAIGWLFTQGLIQGMHEIKNLGLCEDKGVVSIHASPDRWEERLAWRRVLTSGCGAGETLAAELDRTLTPVTDDFHTSIETLRNLARDMLGQMPIHRRTGGMHAAALSDGKTIRRVFEDIGRHNAVDKAIGNYLLGSSSDDENRLLLSTGRLSSDMILKAVRARVSIVASLSVPSDLAVMMARSAGVTLVGRVTSPSPKTYCGHERLINQFAEDRPRAACSTRALQEAPAK